MSTRVAGLTLASPVLVASGCGGTGRELSAYAPLSTYGAFTTRSISRDARPGAGGPTLAETPAGLGEYAEVARRLATAPGVSAVEVNLAVPDAAELGVLDAREPFHVGAAVSTVLRELPRGVPVLAKLRPDPVRVAESVKVAADAGAEAVVLGGALPASLPDGRPAGLSGPAVSPLALRCVADARAALDAAGAECDVIACGGIGTAEDARTALRLGAVAVQVGSALFHDPTTAARLAAALDPDEGA